MKKEDREAIAGVLAGSKIKRAMMDKSLRDDAFAVQVRDYKAALRMIEEICTALLNQDRES